MDEATSERVANEARLTRIEATLGEIQREQGETRAYLAQVLAEIRTAAERTAQRVTSQEMFCAARQPRNETLVENHAKLEKRVEKLEELAPAMRAVIWIGAALGISVIALVWALIIGQATLTFTP